MQTLLVSIFLFVATVLMTALHATKVSRVTKAYFIEQPSCNKEKTDWRARIAFQGKPQRTEFSAYVAAHASKSPMIHGKAEKTNKYVFFCLLSHVRDQNRIVVTLYTNGTLQWRGISGEAMEEIVRQFNDA